MPQRLLLEGSDIDELLQRVRDEHGPQAKIVHAEQKLVGGVAGFFARRRYELAVQVDDEDLARPPVVDPPSGAGSFEDLLAQADDADRAPEQPGRLVHDSPEGRTSEPPSPTGVPSQRGRRLSTQTPQFESLLSSLLGRAERVADEPPAPRRSPAGPAAPEPTTPQVEPDIAGALAATTGVAGATAWDRVVLGRADRRADRGADRGADRETRRADRGAAAPVDAQVAMTAQPSIADVPTSATPATPDSAARTALHSLGLPDGLTPRRLATDPRAAVLDVLAQLPTPAGGRLWGTTVVVGPADLAHRTAAAVVDHTGGTGAEPIRTTCDAPSPADIAVRAAATTTANGAALVVIDTPATRAAARRAGRLLAGLGLGTVVAAVDATRDAAATGEWLAELGGSGRHVDQLALFDVAESPAPLALLGLGVDVGWLDGRPASLGTWAAPCLDRLTAQAP